MRRREFIVGLGAAALLSRSVGAEQRRGPVVGFLSGVRAETFAEQAAAFSRGLKETGYVEGRNLTIEYGWAEGHYDRLPGLAADLVQQKVAAIFATGAIASAQVAFAAMTAKRLHAVVVPEDGMLIANTRRIADLSVSARIPAIGFKQVAPAGGLLAYGVDIAATFRAAAVFVAKIVRGANPQELPIERATRFELVINQRTAKALGIEIPPRLLAVADEVIE